MELASIREKTFTADEEDHYGYGWNILMLNPDSRIVGNGTLMPFNSFNTLPRLVGRQLPDGSIRSFLIALETGRLVTMLFSLLLACYVFKWSRELYGIAAGFFSLFLFAFSPNLIAHSRLITNDIFATCLMTLSLYYFWRMLRAGNWKYILAAAIFTGLSQIAKYTAVFLYPLFAALLIFRYGGTLLLLFQRRDYPAIIRRCLIVFNIALFFGLLSLLIINIGFLFDRVFTPLREYQFESDLFQTLQQKSGLLGALPLPLPVLYLEGPDSRQWETETGEHANAYLFGELRNPECFTGYYFWAYLYKVPIAIQIIILLSIITYWKNRRKYTFSRNEIFIWIPIILFGIYINFSSSIQSGLRYALPVFPLLLILCGNLVKNLKSFSCRSKIGVAILLIYLTGSVLSYFPHYLSYFNELVWDRKLSYKILADSNNQWGQNRGFREAYLNRYPETIGFPPVPRAGKIMVGVNQLIGLHYPETYRWLREHFEPVDHIGYSILIYDVSPEQLERALHPDQDQKE